jgi:hypothetical protein
MILKPIYGFLRKNLCILGTMDLTKAISILNYRSQRLTCHVRKSNLSLHGGKTL